ncbi:hypothetical protein FJZ33_01280 [Candidatus Poribacteria bacterium]|nr:hypothetical protein [Candidatus Poribacteria bacterium]
MRIKGEELERSVGGILSRFGIDKEDARKERKQLDRRIGAEKEAQPEEGPDEKYYAYFLSKFVMIDMAVEDFLMPTLSPVEQAVYRRLYRLSYGFGKSWCQVSYSQLKEACNVSAFMTVQGAIQKLIDINAIKIISPAIQRKAPVYRVYLPCEMPQFANEELETNVIFIKEKVEIQQIREIIISNPEISNLNFRGLIINSLNELSHLKNRGLTSKFSNLNFRGLTYNSSHNNGSQPEKNEKKSPIYNIINNSFKNTLSTDEIISSFYNGLGHSRISKEKRERAKKCIEELIADNFSLEDIQFAVEWTLKTNTEKLYDFSIIKHTIGEAMSAKEKTDAIEKQRIDEENKAILEKEEQERLEKEKQKYESYKMAMSPEDRTKLREKALEQIKGMEGVKEEFITDTLIEFQENEVLRKGMTED